MEVTRVEQHAIQKIKECELIMEPFPHIIVDGILPEDVYTSMMQDIDKLDPIWKVFFKPHLNKHIKVREQINVCNEMEQEYSDQYFDIASMETARISQAEIVDTTAWKDFRLLLAGKALQVALLQKFAEMLSDRLGCGDLASFPKGVTINRETGGFSIAPHTDTQSKLLFGVFYLAQDDKHPELCTNLHTHNENRESWESKPSWAHPKDFSIAKRIEYLPNRMCIMLKSGKCWHSVNIPKEVTTKRYTSYYSIWNNSS
jgi:hypothetical protein